MNKVMIKENVMITPEKGLQSSKVLPPKEDLLSLPITTDPRLAKIDVTVPPASAPVFRMESANVHQVQTDVLCAVGSGCPRLAKIDVTVPPAKALVPQVQTTRIPRAVPNHLRPEEDLSLFEGVKLSTPVAHLANTNNHFSSPDITKALLPRADHANLSPKKDLFQVLPPMKDLSSHIKTDLQVPPFKTNLRLPAYIPVSPQVKDFRVEN
jgi:hypothetical protein